MIPRILRMSMCVLLLTSLAPTNALAGQDDLAAAKELYRAASFAEALGKLEIVRNLTVAASHERREVERYRAFCLIALGRDTEAAEGIEAIVRADPRYVPTEDEVSPRMNAAFHDIRRRVLPGIARETYAAGRGAFDRKDYPSAATQFERVLALMEDADMPQTTSDGLATDLGVLATGFLELSRTYAAAPQR